MQIATHTERSYLNNPNSAEISHALFEEASVSAMSGLYATHPAIEKRIGAILPGWDGDYDLLKSSKREPAEEATPKTEVPSSREKATAILTGAAGVLITDAIINQVGNPDSRHLAYADTLLHQIPEALLDAAHDPSGARAIIYFLVLNKTDPMRRRQLDFLQDCADTGVYPELQKLLNSVDIVAAEQRLPLVEIALSSLRQLSKNQYQRFKKNFNELIDFDKKISLLEWALQKIVFHHLGVVFENGRTPKLGRKDLTRCRESCEVLLSILAHSSRQDGITVADAFNQGAKQLDISTTIIAVSSISFEALNKALDELVLLKPLQKPALLKACAACIAADKEVTPIESELMRAIAATIDCPMPPLLIE